ncbi:MAG: efflux RND transporter periplasmic adaptor subunit [Spartobacteria bacterium]|nr:efflux RND transporter periplasmic adaptor subunit [Spartobacteria bacterium]
MQSKKSKGWLGWTLALAVAGGGVWGWFHFRAANGNGATQYKTQELKRGEIVQTVTANGALGAVQTVLVGSEVSGKIMELFADYNSAVTNGQVLAKLDASTYERQLEQSQAELESSRASLKLAEANFRRAKELRELELVSQADYDQSEASLAQAQAALRMKEASLSKVRVDLEKTTILSPMDGVVISRAVDVGQTVAASLNAPTLFTLAQDLRAMRIEAQISEADVGDVAEGQVVTFTVDAYPALTFTGNVSQVRFEPVTVQNVVNYVAIVDVDNPDLKLRPGMTANAAVITARRENALRLPNAALRFRPPAGAEEPARKKTPAPAAAQGPRDVADRPVPGEGPGLGLGLGLGLGDPLGSSGGSRSRASAGDEADNVRQVYVLDEAGQLAARAVAVGITDGSWTEVVGPGLREGDRIVTGIQSAAEKEKATRSNGSSPFMPSPPQRGPR